ncbi:MAG: rhodanese-related sulfurtransferase [Myxococcota bacterium]|jgi:rhodanese-related sulfurtransferase
MIRRIARRILRKVRPEKNAPAPASVAPSVPRASESRPEPEPSALPELEPELEVDGEGVAAWRSEGRSLVFLDIREPHEINYGHIAGALIIPMNQIPERIAEIPDGQTLIVYCAAGARSFGVTHYLREQGREDSWSLIGGIGAWTEQDESSWHPPPSEAAFKTSSPARLTEAAAERLERDGARKARLGTIQEAKQTPDGLRYVLGIPRPSGGLERIEGLLEEDLEAIGRQPR